MKIIAIDLDGTLLSQKHLIQERDTFWIKKVQSNGNIPVIATGRSYFDALHIMKTHGLNCPIIASNGAQIYIDNKKIQEQFINAETVQHMVSWLQRNNIYFQLYIAEKIIALDNGVEQLNAQVKTVIDEISDFNQDHFWESIKPQTNQYGLELVPYLNKSFFVNYPIIKIMIVSPDKKILEEILTTFSQYQGCVISSSGEFNLEIMTEGVDKGVALQLLAEHFCLDIKSTVAIGDNFNDLPMFKVAGTSILMGNGEKDLHKSVNLITLTNEECGVGHALEFLLPLLASKPDEKKQEYKQRAYL